MRLAIRAWLRHLRGFTDPRHDRSIFWLRSPITVLVAAAVVAVWTGLFLHGNGWVLAAGILTVLILGLLWPWLVISGLQARLRFEPTRIREGEACSVRLEIDNRLPFACWGLALSEIELGAGGMMALTTAPGRRRREFSWRFVPRIRGVYPMATIELASGFPFGLWLCRRTVRIDEPLLVWPRVVPVGPFPDNAGLHRENESDARHHAGISGDLLGVRPYRRGDSPRRIHWAQTARHDRLIVCELQAQSRPSVQVIVALDRCHSDGPDGSREWAIRIAASYCDGWVRRGAQVGLITGGCVLPPRSGSQQRLDMLDALARIQADEYMALGELLQTPAVQDFNCGLQLIIAAAPALQTVSRKMLQRPQRRLIVLRLPWGAGAAHCGEPESLQPWIVLSDPTEVADKLRRPESEVACAR